LFRVLKDEFQYFHHLRIIFEVKEISLVGLRGTQLITSAHLEQYMTEADRVDCRRLSPRSAPYHRVNARCMSQQGVLQPSQPCNSVLQNDVTRVEVTAWREASVFQEQKSLQYLAS
jgi:hypothetical protein